MNYKGGYEPWKGFHKKNPRHEKHFKHIQDNLNASRMIDEVDHCLQTYSPVDSSLFRRFFVRCFFEFLYPSFVKRIFQNHWREVLSSSVRQNKHRCAGCINRVNRNKRTDDGDHLVYMSVHRYEYDGCVCMDIYIYIYIYIRDG